jgi:hypothetical protein
VNRFVLDFPVPRLPSEASGHAYLPQAAMGLGSSRAAGTRPAPIPVSRLLIQHQTGGWCLFRLDDRGGFIGDTWHPDPEDAKRTAADEFDIDPALFREVE